MSMKGIKSKVFVICHRWYNFEGMQCLVTVLSCLKNSKGHEGSTPDLIMNIYNAFSLYLIKMLKRVLYSKDTILNFTTGKMTCSMLHLISMCLFAFTLYHLNFFSRLGYIKLHTH